MLWFLVLIFFTFITAISPIAAVVLFLFFALILGEQTKQQRKEDANNQTDARRH